MNDRWCHKQYQKLPCIDLGEKPGSLVFISDLHLDPEAPDWLNHWQLFSEDLQEQPHLALFILGDFFNNWFPHRFAPKAFQELQSSLQNLSQHMPIYFMIGNRDCLVPASIIQACHMQTIADPSLLLWQDQRLLLTHGDLLCDSDKGHQRYRRLLALPFMSRFFNALPLHWLATIRRTIVSKSQQHKETLKPEQFDVNIGFLHELSQKHQLDGILHGHTHKQEHQTLTPRCWRYNLGTWDDQPGQYSVLDSHDLTMQRRTRAVETQA